MPPDAERSLDARIAAVEARIGSMEVKIAVLETRLDDLRHDVKNIAQKQDALSSQLGALHDTIVAARAARWVISAAAAVVSFLLGVAAQWQGVWGHR